jgi:hypothetical protein
MSEKTISTASQKLVLPETCVASAVLQLSAVGTNCSRGQGQIPVVAIVNLKAHLHTFTFLATAREMVYFDFTIDVPMRDAITDITIRDSEANTVYIEMLRVTRISGVKWNPYK